MRALLNHEVVFRQAEDAAFLWSVRQRALQTARLKPAQRRGLDLRIDARVEGLYLAGEAGWRASLDRLARVPEPGSFFAAMALAPYGEGGQRFERLFAAAGDEHGATLDAMTSAIGWTDFETIRPHLERWAASSRAFERVLGVAGLASHRRPRRGGLASSLRRDDARVRKAAAKAAFELGSVEVAPELVPLLGDESADVRFHAARALARFRCARGRVRRALLALIDGGEFPIGNAVATLASLDPDAVRTLFVGWATHAGSRRLAIAAADALGDPALLPELIPWMDDDALARAAGEAFRGITGEDLVDAKLARKRPARVATDPTYEPMDPRVALDPEHELAFPSSIRVTSWWKAHRDAFLAGGRYLDGALVEVHGAPLAAEHLDALRRVVRSGRPRHQVMAARALAHVAPEMPTVETHAAATNVHTLPGWAGWERVVARAAVRARRRA